VVAAELELLDHGLATLGERFDVMELEESGLDTLAEAGRRRKPA
jgi:hypothetical protein